MSFNPFSVKTTSLWLSNAENTSDANSNQLKLRLSSALQLVNAKVAISKLSFDYAFPNISTANNNSYFSYTVDSVDYKVSFDDGNYDVAAMNAKLEATMYANKHYLTNASGGIVYYLNMRENIYTNKLTLTASVVPASLPSGFTDPATFITDAGSYTLQLVVPATSMATLMGFLAGSYPTSPSATVYNVDSTNTPYLDVVNTILVKCNLSNSKGSIKSASIIYAFTIPSDAEYPGVISVPIETIIWHDCNNGYFDVVEITFLDQNFRDITFSESNHVCELQIITPL